MAGLRGLLSFKGLIMDKMVKRTIAREWLIFLGSICISFLLINLVFPFIFNFEKPYFKKTIEAIIFFILPYIFIQLIRTIVWAIRILIGK
jgi:hypothetical protein